MVGYVFGVAVFNFLLGAALAACRERLAQRAIARQEANSAASAASAAPGGAWTAGASGTGQPAPATDHKLRIQQLQETFQGAFQLGVVDCRARLVELRQRLAENPENALPDEDLHEVETFARSWLSAATAACDALDRGSEGVGEHRPASARLSELLSPVLLRLEAATQSIARFRQSDEPALAGPSLCQEIDELLEDLQVLRDEHYDLRLAVLRDAGGVESLTQEDLADPQTRLHNRLGLEAVHQQWRKEHATADAWWSLAVLDIDGFARLNRRLGPAEGDRLLTAFGALADDLLRKDRGFDRAAHHRNDQFVLFLGDTDLDDAVNAAERIRQTIEASSFSLANGEEVSVTVSVGLATGKVKHEVETILARAEEAVQAAAAAGGNRTARHTSDGPQPEPPRPYQVKGRVVKLDAALEPSPASD